MLKRSWKQSAHQHAFHRGHAPIPMSPRPCVIAHSKLTADGMLVQALEKVLNQISRIIYDHEAKQRKLKASGDVLDVEVQAPGKKVKFRTKASAERLVKEPAPGCQSAGKGLDTYLSLPLTEYALLDPKWITRPNPVDEPDVFVLKVPLYALLGVDLQPQVTIRVEIDQENFKVHFYATKFMVGDARFDANFSLDMDATLSHRSVTDVTQLGANIAATWRSWGNQLAIATGTAPVNASSRSTGSFSSIDSSMDESSSSTSSSSYNASPAMVPLPRSLSPRSSAPAPHTAPQSQPQPQLEAAQPAAAATQQQASDSAAGSSSTDGSDRHSSSGHNGSASHSSHDSVSSVAASASSNHDSSGGNSTALAASSHDSRSSDTDGSSAADAGTLLCAVDLRFEVVFPPPLSVVPGPMLSLAGGLLAKFAVRALLPGFLELLSVDYARWATGSGSRAQAAGNLLSQTPTVTSTPAAATATASQSSIDIEIEPATLQGASTSHGGNGNSKGHVHESDTNGTESEDKGALQQQGLKSAAAGLAAVAVADSNPSGGQ